jgi:hypothetical protein
MSKTAAFLTMLLAVSLCSLGCGGGDVAVKKPDPVFVNKTGVQYHYAGCKSLVRSMRPIQLEDAKAQGYIPCERCDFMKDN